MYRYSTVAIGLHWLIALAILANIGLGVWMGDALGEAQSRHQAIAAFQWHKSIGLSILVLSLLRLAWRFINPPPPLPVDLDHRERRLATVTHALFYVLMIAIPLSGWLYVSAQWRGDAPLVLPTLWFGWFEVPHLFGLASSDQEFRQHFSATSAEIHEWLVWGMCLLLVLHVAAALQHQYLRHDGVLARMLPRLSRSTTAVYAPAKRGWLAASSLVVVAVTFILIGTHSAEESSPPPAIDQALQALTEDMPPVRWQVVQGESEVRFSGAHVNRPFKGQFTRWRAALAFDKAAPGESRIAALIATGSATDGVPLHDKTLPEAEWFNVAEFPFASFVSTRIEPRGNQHYALYGKLTIKDHAIEVPPLSLQVEGEQLRIEGNFSIDRGAVDMGMESDPAGDYVSRTIGIQVQVLARLSPPPQ